MTFPLIIALFSFFAAWGQEPVNAPTPTSMLPQTVIVAMAHVAPGEAADVSAESKRACAFAAQNAADLGFVVANYCAAGSPLSTNQPMPRPGDSTVFLLFVDSGKPPDLHQVKNALPPQAASGEKNVIGLVSSALGAADNVLVVGEGAPFSATLSFPAPSPTMAKIFIRCLFDAKATGATSEEAVTCWNRLFHEETGLYTTLQGSWDPLFNVGKVIYPPRTPPTEKSEGKAAQALLRYDREQKRKQPPLLPPPGVETPVAVAPPPSPLPTEPLPKRQPFGGWGTPKIMTVTFGGAVTVLGTASLASVYSGAHELGGDIERGAYGTSGPELENAVQRYNALGDWIAPLWVTTAVGAGALGVGILLPVEGGNVHVTVTPSGAAVSGTF